MTLVEVLVVIVVLVVLTLFLLPAIFIGPQGPMKITCISNLHQIGLAYKTWEGDNGDKYPMGVSVTLGGSMEMAATGYVVQTFQVMSNQLSTAKVLHCPADMEHFETNSFAGLPSSNISYFVGVDVTNDMNPQMILDGDDNFEINGVPVKSGLLELSTNAPIAWTAARHHFAGNIGLADGSAQELNNSGLTNLLQQTGVVTNRLAIP